MESVVADIIPSDSFREIQLLDKDFEEHFRDKFLFQLTLSRPLVSFQANKTRPVYRWYKYKEAFSASLVENLFRSYGVTRGRILDPFAGSGTALFVANELGIDADGIELLPIGHQIINTKKILESEFIPNDFDALQRWMSLKSWNRSERRIPLLELRITRGAYPERTKESIEKYLAALLDENERVQAVLRFALLCVLESISYTRKDGQYLRWDYRSGRKQGKHPFNKGEIIDFDNAISEKINEIISDLKPINRQGNFFSNKTSQGSLLLYSGSCLDTMPKLADNTYDAVMTSPPYCNRYDYTRTYALELALMGTDEKRLADFRQEMLSCTVENRAKNLLGINPKWAQAVDIADKTKLLQSILKFLDGQKETRMLNNNGIPRMVRGYFYEMACIIGECARVLKPNGLFFMVNDNVRYAGASISVDMILSSLAEGLGLRVENILVLPTGKGNSSQQMGTHGREELRKCVYVWRKA